MPEKPVFQQVIRCLNPKCPSTETIQSNDTRVMLANVWPAWTPGPHLNLCPTCHGDCWAEEPTYAPFPRKPR